MSQRKVIVYIACSTDGYIARRDGDLDWLSLVERQGEDYGYYAFLDTIDTVIMGRKTYDKVLSFGIGFPHAGRACYVVSRTRTGNDEHVTFFNGDIGDLVAQLRSTPGKDIFIDGGAELIDELMKRDLVDRYILSVIPVLLGDGIRLFRDGRPEQVVRLVHSRAFDSGLVQLWYERGDKN